MKKRIERMYTLIEKRRTQTIRHPEYLELETLLFFFGEPKEFKELIDKGL